jgi:ubiquinone/menaquinone biosynthesis C-methylase UbiE
VAGLQNTFENTASCYDRFASAYDHLFAPEAAQGTLIALERILFSTLGPGAEVLDLCCGTGSLTGVLTGRGYRVLAIDSSDQMLACARRRVPEAEFLQADIRTLRLDRTFDAVVCAYNSLPHVTDPADLARVFCGVRRILKQGGRFVFDLYNRSAYAERWRGSFAKVDEEYVCIVQASYDREQRRGTNDITIFQKNGIWERSDVKLVTRSYSDDELLAWLTAAGYGEIEALNGLEAFSCSALAGRVFWSCRSA